MANGGSMTRNLFDTNVFAHLADWQAQGLKTALAVLIGVDGSSPRPIGAQIGVAEDGRSVGMISSGCAEEAIIAEAIKAIDTDTHHTIRYGKDSPYLDIVLPCGSGLDVFISSRGIREMTQAAQQLHETRQIAYVRYDAMADICVEDAPTHKSIAYPPDYRLHVFGAGQQLLQFAQLAQFTGYKIIAHSPDAAALEVLKSQGIEVASMTHQSRFDPTAFDAHSAVLTLFHQHDLELAALHAALNSKASFIGALGSRKTHAQRQAHLAQTPTKRPFSDISGPIGLDIGATDPAEISISILAQLIERRRKA